MDGSTSGHAWGALAGQAKARLSEVLLLWEHRGDMASGGSWERKGVLLQMRACLGQGFPSLSAPILSIGGRRLVFLYQKAGPDLWV